MKILTQFGGSLIITHMRNPQKINGSLWQDRGLGSPEFVEVRGDSGKWYSVFRENYGFPNRLSYVVARFDFFFEAALFWNGYQSYVSRRGSVGQIGEWMNAVVFPMVFDKFTEANGAAWQAVN